MPNSLVRPLFWAVAALALVVYAAAFAQLLAGRDPGLLAVGALLATVVLIPASKGVL